MKRRGFTLIELLAVIVILAIIALIATPIVLDIIEDSKVNSIKRSSELYMDGVEQAVARYQLNGKTLSNGTYYIMENGNLCSSEITDNKCTETEIKVTVEGNKPTSGRIVIKDGQVQTTSTMIIGDYEISYDEKEKDYVMKKLYKGILCIANTTKVSALIYEGGNQLEESSYTRQEVGLIASESGAYTPGVAYTCELGDNESNTFYVLEENGDNVSLIAGFNLGDTVALVSTEDYLATGGVVTDKDDGGKCQYGDYCAKNDLGPITATRVLKERTLGWSKLTESQISLPSYDQIYKAAGNKNSNFSTWLNSYTKTPVALGYWTSTPDESRSYLEWTVGYGGGLESFDVGFENHNGIRPVIAVLKSQLN